MFRPRLFLLLVVCVALATSEAYAQKKLPPVENETPIEITGEAPVKAVRAFSAVRFDRPIFVEPFGKSGKLIVGEQRGRLMLIENDPEAESASVFFDLKDKVTYKDKENEEGLLGIALHPNFEENGEFFLYYTTSDAPHTSVLTRFRRDKNNPEKADTSFSEELLRIPQPFWNHNGGTIAFGPDGYLYVALGDGGSANDPQGNGQNTQTLLGSILRIDVDSKTDKKPYGIPKDNPFAGKPDAGLPEIYAYGLRNVWRMAFDSETGHLWAADVGQNLWEEVNIIENGGNYGWNHREGFHDFKQPEGKSASDYKDPVWEYYHTVGKSVTGGFVYRGSKLPALTGKYLYADYVTGKLYAIGYDAEAKKVTTYETIEGPNLPVMSFGMDADGEPFFTTTFGLLYTFEAK